MDAHQRVGSSTAVQRRLSRQQAEEAVVRGEMEKPEPQSVWSEEEQGWVARGQAIVAALQEREADPAWQLQQYDKTRTALVEFVASKMQEAEYDKLGYPIPGNLHDYYVVPGGGKTKALTKLGAEKMADLRRVKRGASRVTSSIETKEYVSALVNCELVDSFNRVVGAHEAAASTAESGFQAAGARRKYGAKGKWRTEDGGRKVWHEEAAPDYRAALNDVVARAGKRAFVGAIIVACAADEIFEVAASLGDEKGRDEDDERVRTSKEASARRKQKPQQQESRQVEYDENGALRSVRGKPMAMYTTAEIEVMYRKTREAGGRQKLEDALATALEARRLDEMPAALEIEDDDELPF